MGMVTQQERVNRLFTLRGKCDPPADEYLQIAVDLDHINLLVSLLESGQIDLRLSVCNLDSLRACIAHWIIILRINRNKKIIYKHPWGKDADTFKPLAEIYAVVWDAMSNLMDIKCYLPESVNQFSCTAEWFACILYEFALISVSDNTKGKKNALGQLQKRNNTLTCIKNGTKKQILRTIKNSQKAIDHLEKIWSKERFPHTYEMFLILLERDQDGFERVVKAMKSFATHFDLNIPPDSIIFSNENEDFRNTGRGSSRFVHDGKLVDVKSLTMGWFERPNGEFDSSLEKYETLCIAKEKAQEAMPKRQ